MRILHTSDWHLGATLSNHSRIEEQRALIDEICRIARDKKIDMLLIAGDIYDTYNPPAWAEQLFLTTLAYLTDLNIPVIAIAGNHDSPDRLSAPADLAASQSAYILTLPNQSPKASGLIDCGPNWLRLRPHGADCEAVVAALPYPSPGRLDCDEADYSNRVGSIMAEACSHFTDDAVSIALTHLFARGGVAGTSERPIEGVGGVLAVDTEALGNAQYTALGHLHRMQHVGNAWYSGSIMQQDFGEGGQARQVLIIELEPGSQAQVTPVPLVCGRYLARWQVGSLDEAMSFVSAGRDAQAWVEIVLNSANPPSEEQMRQLHSSRERIVYIRWAPEIAARQRTAVDWTGKPKAELFESFYRDAKGSIPSRDLVALFLRMCDGTDGALLPDEAESGEYNSAIDEMQTQQQIERDEAEDRAAVSFTDVEFESDTAVQGAELDNTGDGSAPGDEAPTAEPGSISRAPERDIFTASAEIVEAATAAAMKPEQSDTARPLSTDEGVSANEAATAYI